MVNEPKAGRQFLDEFDSHWVAHTSGLTKCHPTFLFQFIDCNDGKVFVVRIIHFMINWGDATVQIYVYDFIKWQGIFIGS